MREKDIAFFAVTNADANALTFQASLLEAPLRVAGICLDDTMNINNWQVPKSEFPSLVSQMNSGKIRIMTDHADSVDSVIGKITKAWVQNNQIHYQGEVLDKQISTKIERGYLTGVSIRGTARKVYCAECLRETTKEKGCKLHPDSGIIVSGLTLREISLVVSPAYANTSIYPLRS